MAGDEHLLAMFDKLDVMRTALQAVTSAISNHVEVGYSNPMQQLKQLCVQEQEYVDYFNACKVRVDQYKATLDKDRQALERVGVGAPQYPQHRDEIHSRMQQLKQFQKQLGTVPTAPDSSTNIVGCLEDLDLIRIDYEKLKQEHQGFEKTRGIFSKPNMYPELELDATYRPVGLVLNDVRNLKRDTKALLDKTTLSLGQRAALETTLQEALKLEAAIMPDVGAAGRKRFEQYMEFICAENLAELEEFIENAKLERGDIHQQAQGFIEQLAVLRSEQSEVWRVREMRQAVQGFNSASEVQARFDALRQLEKQPAQLDVELSATHDLLNARIQTYTGIISDLEAFFEHEGKALLIEQPELEGELDNFKQALKQLKHDAKEPWMLTRVVEGMKDLLGAAARFFKALVPTSSIDWTPFKNLIHKASMTLVGVGATLITHQQEALVAQPVSSSNIDLLIAGSGGTQGLARIGLIHDLEILQEQASRFDVLKNNEVKRAKGEEVTEEGSVTQRYKAEVNRVQHQFGAGEEETFKQHMHTQFKQAEGDLNQLCTRLINDTESTLKNQGLTPVQRTACDMIRKEAKSIQAKAEVRYQDQRALKAYEASIDYEPEDLPITLDNLRHNH